MRKQSLTIRLKVIGFDRSASKIPTKPRLPALKVKVLTRDKKRIFLEANNPTESDIETLVETPQEISDRYHLRARIKVPAGSSVRLEFRK